MAIVAADIQFLLSAPQAGSGYTMAGVPGNSLGLFASTTQLSQTPLGNLFTDIPGAANAADQIDYQCLFVFNNNQAGHAMLDPVAWLPASLLGPVNTASFAVGADPTSPSVLGSGSPQAVAIQNPTLAPAGVATWKSPSADASTGIALPDIPSGYVAAVWIRRSASGSGGLNQFVFDVTFDTLA